MAYYKDFRSSDVKIVVYDDDYVINNLGMTRQDIEKYGCPMGIKFEGCDVVIPIPSKNSVRSNMKKIIKTESRSKEHEGKNLTREQIGKIISTKLAKEFFM